MSFFLSVYQFAAPLGCCSSTSRSAVQALSPHFLRGCQSQRPCRQQYRHDPKRDNRHATFTTASQIEGAPSRNALIGRENDLRTLWAAIQPQPKPARRVVLVHGPEGVGKSRLVSQFSQLHQNDFSTTLWVDGRNRNSVMASLGALASRLPTEEDAPSSDTTLEEQASIALDWLSKKENSKWLLIFDDGITHQSAKMASKDDAYSILDFFPRSDYGSILVTSAGPDMAEIGESHALRKLDPQESLEFLDIGIEGQPKNSQTGNQVGEEAIARNSLVRQLEGLPLALTHASCYIHQTGVNISSYLQLFQETQQHLQETTDHKCDGAMVTCALSFKRIEQSQPSAAKLLLLLSCYNNARIPSSLLEYGRDNQSLPEWFTDSPSPEGRFVKDFQTLRDFSLITALDNDGTYSMHSAVKRWCRENLKKKQQEGEGQEEELNTVALVSVGTAAAQALEGEGSPGDRLSLLPHADEMRRLLQDGSLVSSNEQTLSAIKSLGSLYEDQGLLKRAEGMYLHALLRSQDLFGPSHRSTREVVRSLQRLRALQGSLGKIFGSSWWTVLETFLTVTGQIIEALSQLLPLILIPFSWLFFW